MSIQIYILGGDSALEENRGRWSQGCEAVVFYTVQLAMTGPWWAVWSQNLWEVTYSWSDLEISIPIEGRARDKGLSLWGKRSERNSHRSWGEPLRSEGTTNLSHPDQVGRTSLRAFHWQRAYTQFAAKQHQLYLVLMKVAYILRCTIWYFDVHLHSEIITVIISCIVSFFTVTRAQKSTILAHFRNTLPHY